MASAIFYERLFGLAPRLRSLFPEDLAEQRKKQMATLGVAALNLNNWDKVIPVVRQLGLKHRGYGAHERDYATVGQGLIETLAIGLKDNFTP